MRLLFDCLMWNIRSFLFKNCKFDLFHIKLIKTSLIFSSLSERCKKIDLKHESLDL